MLRPQCRQSELANDKIPQVSKYYAKNGKLHFYAFNQQPVHPSKGTP